MREVARHRAEQASRPEADCFKGRKKRNALHFEVLGFLPRSISLPLLQVTCAYVVQSILFIAKHMLRPFRFSRPFLIKAFFV